MIHYLRTHRLLSRVPRLVIGAGVSALLIVAVVLADSVPQDIGWLALAVFALMAAATVIRALPWYGIERLATYTLAAVAVYLLTSSDGLLASCDVCVYVFFIGLTVAMALWIRFSSRQDFRVTTLDFLVIAIVAVVPNIPALRDSGMGVAAMEALALFYACEILIAKQERRLAWLPIVVFLGLAILAVRGVFFGGSADLTASLLS